ncbi:hypothetical protein Lfu02_55230 [Longispora fulva]|uniref:CRISPR/Cas system-associated exonuclease Cas4 (RecB family) n=1 Tax=Longispora fulva TaxID=619741 RepID=A0A8J7KL39_9ACTN|nr:PD-(D/E)XK nuclease family protein [Longispora fulva]MBG6137496.1 CRISPR/Cas system-associated exonuclease Cas4 (RecB family) [Longispora fulva]GIG61151.1 hypothetical protein Lfu02_55230 [Longispora fulva]
MTLEIISKSNRSVSQLDLYLTCGERYRLRYIDGHNEPPAAWLFQGTEFHGVAEDWELNNRTESAEWMTSEYERRYLSAVENAKREWPELWKWQRAPKQRTEDDIVSRLERGQTQLRAYHDHALSSDWRILRDDRLPRGVGLEVAFELEFNEVILRGFIDQVRVQANGEITADDLKTGAKKPESPVQLAVYAAALREIYGLNVHRGSYYMAKDGKAGKLLNVSHPIEQLEAWFTMLNRGILAGVFLPKPGSHCTMCGMKPWCSYQKPELFFT